MPVSVGELFLWGEGVLDNVVAEGIEKKGGGGGKLVDAMVVGE